MPDETGYFYYFGQQKKPIERLDDTVAVAMAGAITDKRLQRLQESERAVDALGLNPALLERNILVHRTAPAASGPQRVGVFAGRLSAAPTVRFVTHIFHDPASDSLMILTDEIAVRFKPEVAQDQIDALNAQLGVEIVEVKPYAPNQFLLRVLEPTPMSRAGWWSGPSRTSSCRRKRTRTFSIGNGI